MDNLDLKKAKAEGYIEALKDAYDKLDEGVCDECENSSVLCHKNCGSMGFEMDAYRKWLLRQLEVVKNAE